MGTRNKRIFMFTICYNHVVSKLGATRRQRKKWNSYSWPQKSYLDFEVLVPIFPKLDYHQCLKYIHLSFGKYRHLEEFNMLVFIVKTLCCSKKKLSRDLCSPGSCQLLQLQPLFPNFFYKNFGPSFQFYLIWDWLVSWTLSFPYYNVGFFEVEVR